MNDHLPRRAALAGLVLALACCSALAQAKVNVAKAVPASALCDAPQAQPFASSHETEYRLPARKYAEVIEPGQAAETLSPVDKLIFSFYNVARPINLVPALYSASYEQLFQTDPKYGNDSGAFGQKFGASLLRSATTRVLSDGIFPGVFHEDPRFYRTAHGSVFHRSLLAARQAIVRRDDAGDEQFNYSGITGRAVAAALTTTYYPSVSVTGRVVLSTFYTSILTNAGDNLVLEFLPSIVRKFPIMQKLRLE